MERNPIATKFNAQIITPNFGYKDQFDYYNKASGYHRIRNIKVPTLFFHSLDDPLIMSLGIDWKSIAENPNTVLATTDEGGHTGYHESILNIWNQWWIDTSLDFFDAFQI
jgi:predicted alpha/beta-fold hydrolase